MGPTTPFLWGPEQRDAFNFLKTKLTTTPILITPNWSIVFHVHTDASLTAVGAIPTQPHPKYNLDRPIYYASRLLNSAERNYTTTER